MRISDWSSDGCSSYLLQQDAAGQRVAVRAQTWGGEADEDVAGLDVLTGDQVVALGGADREAHEVELAGLHGAGVLGHLPADQSAAGLATAVGDALDELLDVVGVALAEERKTVVWGKKVAVRVVTGWRCYIKRNTKYTTSILL